MAHNDLKLKMKVETDYFFLSISWLRLYDTEHVMAGRWGFHEETIRNKVRNVVEKLAALAEEKIQGDVLT